MLPRPSALTAIQRRPAARSLLSPLRSKGLTARHDRPISRPNKRFRESSSPPPDFHRPSESAEIMSRRHKQKEAFHGEKSMSWQVDPSKRPVLPSAPTLCHANSA